MTDRHQLAGSPAIIRSLASGRLLLVSALLVVLAGCAATPEPEPPSSPLVLPGSQLDGSIRGDTADPRMATLWADAETARRAGNDQQAIDLLLEGLSLDSRNSLFWSRAAEIQLRNDQSALAENYALKSNEFADKNRSLLLRNWLMIRHARSMRGDLLGVRGAEKRVQEYRYRRE